MGKIKILWLTVIISMMMLFTSCTLTPCDCFDASVNNDTKTMKKCDEKVSKMSPAEKEKWYKEEALNCK